MITRYSLPRMSGVWSEENRFRKMLDVEIYACEALAKLGKIPKASLLQIQHKARFDVEKIKEIELETNHDVIAFIKNLSENIGEDAKYVHMGLTSSDVLDTALSAQMQEACDILIDDVKKLMRGTILEIRAAEPRRVTALLRERLRAASVGLFGDRVHVVTADPEQAAAEASAILAEAGVPLAAVRAIPPSLEDVFISVLTQKETAK